MATLPKTGTVTYEEWLQMPETNLREEVVNGEIRIVPPEKLPHAGVVTNLAAAFYGQLDRKTTEFFASTFGLVIRGEPLTSRSPDIALFDRSTMVEKDGYVHSAPQLAIEVLSPTETRKEPWGSAMRCPVEQGWAAHGATPHVTIAEKLRDYESIGTTEVWLVSPEAATVEILLLEDGKLRRTAILAEGVLKPKHFPAVQIDISEIWPD